MNEGTIQCWPSVENTPDKHAILVAALLGHLAGTLLVRRILPLVIGRCDYLVLALGPSFIDGHCPVYPSLPLWRQRHRPGSGAGLRRSGALPGAKDTIADAIAGLTILVDQPFRVGHRIEIEKVGTWGQVVDIGLRATTIGSASRSLTIRKRAL
jgi:hypothetical protein